jgi:outer membrane protein OmpA-like peptidoglycan-associated protein
MLQAPTTEPKEQAKASRTAVMPEPQRILHPRVAGMAGANHEASPGSPPSGADRLPQRFAAAQRNVGNQAVLRMLSRSKPVLQPKLVVNQPGDQYEQEADSVAEQVMRMPEREVQPLRHDAADVPKLMRKCSCGDSGGASGSCSGCAEKEELRRSADASSPVPEAPPIVSDVIRSPGEPLDAAIRSFMEPRFGYDFSRTRVHLGGQAARSASAVNARAYTVGERLVFGEGQYHPRSASGQRLIAHELAHVVQQSHAHALAPRRTVSERVDASEQEAESAAAAVTSGHTAMPRLKASPVTRLQRACGPALGKPTPDCAASDTGILGTQFLFDVNCDQLRSFEVSHLDRFAKSLTTGTNVNVHGFASLEGNAGFNLDLSCHRANKLAFLLRTARPDCNVAQTFKHGAQGGQADAELWRAASVEIADRPVVPAKETCGPDATDWFVTQVGMANTNAKVLDIKSDLDDASRLAPALGLTSESILEGAVLEKVLKAESTAGKPPRTADASAQIAKGTPGLADLHAAEADVATQAVKLAGGGLPDTTSTELLFKLRSAALNWKALVGHAAPYDFKAHTMKSPTTPHCPDSCGNTVTFCPGSSGSNCFRTDMPGNLFYAHIGAFVGFSENVLQLGSQFAQLTPPSGSKSKAAWDPPEDTAMIRFGFGLTNPLTRTDLCDDLRFGKASFDTQVCADCTEPTTAGFNNP